MTNPGVPVPLSHSAEPPRPIANGRAGARTTEANVPPGQGGRSEESWHPAGARPPGTRHLILLPTLNEERGLEATLAELDRVSFRAPQSPPAVLVIDGHSTDGTRCVAERWGVNFLTQRATGKGAAIREGLAWAVREGYDAVAVMDADGTYPGASLPAMFDLMDLGRELVVGVRQRIDSSRRTLRDLVHEVGNGLLNYAAAQFSRRPVLDVCSGFWGLRTEVLSGLALESDGFDIEAELFVKAFRGNLRVAQFPITYRERVGTAKLHAVRDGARIFLSIVRHSLRPRPAAARAAARPPEPRPLLNAILLGLAPQHVVLMNAPDRRVEADAVARRLSAAIPEAAVVRATLPSLRPASAAESLLPGLTEPSSTIGATVVVALPSRERFGDEPAPLWLGLPGTRRIVGLQGSLGGLDAPEGARRGLSPRYRRERLPRGPFAALYILGASLAPTRNRRELALLGANSAGCAMEVACRAPPPARRAGATPSHPVSRPTAMQRLVGG